LHYDRKLPEKLYGLSSSANHRGHAGPIGKATLTGTIKDSAQKPLHYATVELVRQHQPTQVVKSTYTNDKGKFTLTGIDTGSYQLIVSHTGYAEQRQDLTIADGQPVEAKEITLGRASATLQG
jgi:hypothetical protein